MTKINRKYKIIFFLFIKKNDILWLWHFIYIDIEEVSISAICDLYNVSYY